jgi:hypothetical protein
MKGKPFGLEPPLPEKRNFRLKTLEFFYSDDLILGTFNKKPTILGVSLVYEIEKIEKQQNEERKQ